METEKTFLQTIGLQTYGEKERDAEVEYVAKVIDDGDGLKTRKKLWNEGRLELHYHYRHHRLKKLENRNHHTTGECSWKTIESDRKMKDSPCR